MHVVFVADVMNANLDSLLASTTENLTKDAERDIYNTNNLSQRPDSDYKCEQGNHPAL